MKMSRDPDLAARRRQVVEARCPVRPPRWLLPHAADTHPNEYDRLSASRQLPIVLVLRQTAQQIVSVLALCRVQ